MKRPDRKKRLDIPRDQLAWLSMKKVRQENAQRLALLAARRGGTIEYALDLVLQVGLAAYEEEDGVSQA